MLLMRLFLAAHNSNIKLIPTDGSAGGKFSARSAHSLLRLGTLASTQKENSTKFTKLNHTALWGCLGITENLRMNEAVCFFLYQTEK